MRSGGSRDWSHFTAQGMGLGVILGVAQFGVYYGPAYRTPPVRGEDRVHLHGFKTQSSIRISFSPAQRTRA